jgi:hypothetical protein
MTIPKQIIKFKVDSIEFNSEKDALDYIESKNKEKSIQNYNCKLLESHGGSFIPIYDPENECIDIFIKTEIENTNGYKWWKSLIKDMELRYYDTELKILTNDEFMEIFKKYPSFYINSNQWNIFLFGITHINENAKNPLDWREVIELIGQIQVSPVTIYSD